MNIAEIGLMLDTQSMFSDLLVLIINELVFHFNYSSFPGSNFYCFKTSPYMLYLKANWEHSKVGSSMCVFPEKTAISAENHAWQ